MIGQNNLTQNISSLMIILHEFFTDAGSWLKPYFDQILQLASSGGIGGAIIVGIILGILLRGILLKVILIVSLICIFFVLKDMGYIK